MTPESASPAAATTPASQASAASAPNDSEQRKLAGQAWEQGQSALIAGDLAAAMRWLDRAHRLAPTDGAITLSLATACLGRDAARAAALFLEVATVDDVREAWLGLAAARLQCDDAAGAAAALHAALARHAVDPRLASPGDTLADLIARRAGAAGWCGLIGDGQLVVRPVIAGTVETWLDGAALPRPILPANQPHASGLSVTVAGRHLLGSPIQLGAVRRMDGRVELAGGALRGWAWHPGDPEQDPALTISGDGGGQPVRIVATDATTPADTAQPLARPRGFAVQREALRHLRGRLRVCGPDGRELAGSPIERRGRSSSMPVAPRRRHAGAAVLLPMRGDAATSLASVQAVLATVAPPHRVVVLDDGADEPLLRRLLDRLAAAGRIMLERHAGPGMIDAAVAARDRRDVVLLEPVATLPRGWLERLQAAALSRRDVGVAAPLPQDGVLAASMPPLELDALAQKANGVRVIDVDAAVGACLYVRGACLDGGARFATAERPSSWRVSTPGRRQVVAAGLCVPTPLETMYPAGRGHGAGRKSAAHSAGTKTADCAPLIRPTIRRASRARRAPDREPISEPIAATYRDIELVHWRADVPRDRSSVIMLTHDQGGGVERQIGHRAEELRSAGHYPVVLRPAGLADGTAGVAVGDDDPDRFAHLRFGLHRELPALLRLLRATRPAWLEVHHTLGHDPAVYDLIARLGVPYAVYVHDYPWFCPRVSLVGPTHTYCGEPPPTGCEICIAEAGRIIDEQIGVAALIARSSRFLAGARSVCVPSADAAARMRRHFPALRPRIVPHEDDRAIAAIAPPTPRARRCRVCLAGAIGEHKGFDVLLACARDAAARQLLLDFVVVGHSIDDASLLETGRVFVTGEYEPDEVVGLIRKQDASLALLPSVWPETWCFALTELWHAGLTVAAFDLGAPAERIRQTGRGFLLPPGTPAAAVNDALLQAVGLTSHTET